MNIPDCWGNGDILASFPRQSPTRCRAATSSPNRTYTPRACKSPEEHCWMACTHVSYLLTRPYSLPPTEGRITLQSTTTRRCKGGSEYNCRISRSTTKAFPPLPIRGSVYTTVTSLVLAAPKGTNDVTRSQARHGVRIRCGVL